MAVKVVDSVLGLVNQQIRESIRRGREPRYLVLGRQPYEMLVHELEGMVEPGVRPVKLLSLDIVMVERLPEMIQVVSSPDRQYIEAREEEK